MDIFGLQIRFLSFSLFLRPWALPSLQTEQKRDKVNWSGDRRVRCFYSRSLWGWKQLALYASSVFLLSWAMGEKEMVLLFKIHHRVYNHENPLMRRRHIHTHAELLLLSSLVIVVAFNKSCSVSRKHLQVRGVVRLVCWNISRFLSKPTVSMT